MEHLYFAYIFFRFAKDEPAPRPIAEFHKRAARFVRAVNHGNADRLWRQFIEPARGRRAGAAEDADAAAGIDPATEAAAQEAALEHRDQPLLQPSGTMQPEETVARKMAFYAAPLA